MYIIIIRGLEDKEEKNFIYIKVTIEPKRVEGDRKLRE